MENLKAIVMDMDGTLLNENNEISEETRRHLIDLEKQGVVLVLASGRSYPRLLPYAKQLKMDEHGGWLIEVDGIAVYDVENERRTKYCEMSPEEVFPVYDFLCHQNAEAQAMFDDGMFVFIPRELIPVKQQLRRQMKADDDFPWTAGPWKLLADLRDGYPNITYVDNALSISRPINKIQIMQEEDKLNELYEKLQDQFSDRYSIYRTTPTQLEVLPLGYSKGAAVQKLMEKHGWKPEEVAVFGDGENDCSMFEATPLSFAMANAREYVQVHAAALAGRNTDNGILEGLKKIPALRKELNQNKNAVHKQKSDQKQ